MIVTSNFDGGNVEAINTNDFSNIELKIRKDNQSDFYQWFYFRASAIKDLACHFTIINAEGAAYEDGWENYNVCASYDRLNWFRVKTVYRGGKLSFTIKAGQDSLYFAYFAPYSMERHLDLIAETATYDGASTHVLGHTIDGQAMDLIEIGDVDRRKKETWGKHKKKIWLIARQHPGETMAHWWMEGAIRSLLDTDNPVSRRLLEKARFFIVPNMNPDGSRRGHLRTNAAGINLNRVWNDPNLETSPEVYLVRQKMHETGVDFHLDVHGDEGLPYNFIAGFEGIPSVTDKQLELLNNYQNRLLALSPDFQRQHGYPKDPPGTSDLKKCTDYVAETFGCLAMTLEMPFKDNANMPDPLFGWSPQRCQHLAGACLQALDQMIDAL